jgi:Putative transposase/Transposase zinc-binding domain
VPRLGPAYVPRRPHDTVLYRLVLEHYETFLAHTRAAYRAPLPRYVTDAFEAYLLCGDFSQGFVRCHCDACAHDVLLPLSCKQRGLCPSCGTRRMCDTAATVTDRILPNVPVRQWVMSLPFELRGLAALKPNVLTALGRIFVEEIARTTKRLAGEAGAETGAVSFPQRFGGSLNLHVHFHTLAADGVFEKHGGGVRWHDAPAPEKADLEALVRRVHRRALRWLRRHGYLDEGDAEERPNDREPMADFAVLALAGGAFSARPFVPSSDDASFEKKERRFSASYEGFDVHCAVRIPKDNDEGRERLVRYCARPPFALDRIEVLNDGQIAYRMKTPRRGSTHRVMSPMEFMARLAILVPPPYFPLTRYHGVFSARSKWRPLVTPKPPPGAVVPGKKSKSCKSCKEPERRGRRDDAPPVPPPPRPSPSPSPPSATPAVSAAADDPTVITLKHWDRLLDGALYAVSSRLDWAVLLRRTHGIDALRCPDCGGKLRPLATITDHAVATKILLHLGRRATPLPRARARDPTGQESFGFDAA